MKSIKIKPALAESQFQVEMEELLGQVDKLSGKLQKLAKLPTGPDMCGEYGEDFRAVVSHNLEFTWVPFRRTVGITSEGERQSNLYREQ